MDFFAELEKEFVEDDHPRGQGGRFTFSGKVKEFSLGDKEARSADKVFRRIDMRDKLTDEDKKIVRAYSNDSRINGALNRGEVSGGDPRVKALDRVINKAPLSEETTVYRGLKLSKFKGDASDLEGKVIGTKGYMSTSTDPNWGYSYTPPNGYLAQITLPKGYKALPVGDLSVSMRDGDDQKEVLLGRGGRFKVVGVDKVAFSQPRSDFKELASIYQGMRTHGQTIPQRGVKFTVLKLRPV